MKYYESHFDDYIMKNNKINLHPELNCFNTILKNFKNFKNLILFGPSGTGKYTQALSLIKNLSPSLLKYEKKLLIGYNKTEYLVKISDIHYEIDMALLGCNSKLLWHEIYIQILDIICTKQDKSGIIICKNFHEINSELLETFYSYMQKNMLSINLYFIIITNEISFFPENIINCCKTIHIGRPNKTSYIKSTKKKINNEVSIINNIKYIYSTSNDNLTINHKIICDKIILQITSIENINLIKFRDLLYDLLIYNLDLTNCIWYIINDLIKQKKIYTNKQLSKILIKLYTFLRYYNNNYRPIYHIENFFLSISLIINYSTDNDLL